MCLSVSHGVPSHSFFLSSALFSFFVWHLACAIHLLYLFLSYRLKFATIDIFVFFWHFSPCPFVCVFMLVSRLQLPNLFLDTSWSRGCTCSVPASFCVWSAKPVLSSFASCLSRTLLSDTITHLHSEINWDDDKHKWSLYSSCKFDRDYSRSGQFTILNVFQARPTIIWFLHRNPGLVRGLPAHCLVAEGR